MNGCRHLFEGVARQVLANRMAGEFDDDVGLGDVGEAFLGVLGGHARAVPDVAIEFERVGQFGEDPIDECAVDVVAAEMRIAVGREHLEDAFLDAENRNVESAAAEVEHGDVAGRHLVEAVGERRGGRFVDEAHDFETGEAAGILGGLALAVVEVGGHGDYDALDFFVFVVAKRAFGVLFERAQDFGGDLRRREDALADLKAHDRAAQVGEGVACAIFGRDFVAAESHIALDGSDDGAVFAAGKADCADAAVALDGQMRFHLDCALADGDCAVRRNRDDARQQRAARSRRRRSRAARRLP